MKPVNSRQKGKAGERESVAYLKKIGFHDARRRQQSKGFAAAEVECIDTLPNVHFEIKCGYTKGFSVGSALFHKACAQAFGDCHRKEWALLWREKGCKIWKLTYASANGIGNATVSGNETVAETLRWLDGGGGTNHGRYLRRIL